MVFDESIDLYNAANISLNVIDPAKLPRRIDERGHCVPVFPHDAIKTNTIFEVVKNFGGRTAWADKHPAYDLVNGPSGRGVGQRSPTLMVSTLRSVLWHVCCRLGYFVQRTIRFRDCRIDGRHE